MFDISKERAEDFAKRMTAAFGEKFNVKIAAAESSDDAVKDADIITCVTTSKKPVFNGKLVKKGAHINGVGAYTPEMQEIDEYIILNADKVYVDTRDGVLNEAGDFTIPISKGIYSSDRITGELGEAIAKKVPCRVSDDEITVFKTTGSAVLDVVTARRIYENALAKKMGSIINF